MLADTQLRKQYPHIASALQEERDRPHSIEQKKGLDDGITDQIIRSDKPLLPEYQFEVYSAGDALQPLPPINWLVDGLISEGSLTLLVGEPGSKKTYAMLALAVCLATGTPWIGRDTTKSKVLYIDEEGGKSRLLNRIRNTLNGYSIDDGSIPLRLISMAGFALTEKSGIHRFRALIDQEKPNVVIIDALADVMLGADENSVKDVQPVFSALRKIADESDTAFIVIHHTNKSGGYRGSSAMKGAVDILLTVDSPESSQVLKFKTEKVRDGEPVEFSAIATFGEDSFMLSQRNDAAELSELELIVLEFVNQNGPSKTDKIKEYAQSRGINPELARQAASDLRRRDYFLKDNKLVKGKATTYEINPKYKL